ncbi:uncharacterized protein LOC115625417 [Scaptodrosophila lebanonensis]|uniref:Uncharacterized protein LOC115625417 n=1 Tax=Drosophila lebanonensis TaxID=7225 RepID=A0A6J2TMU7_DROLE|nr:uncharacterized protein LOC115625417 [Scaptodrosophila lebanonensis]
MKNYLETLIIVIASITNSSALLYPESTSMSLTSSVSIPVHAFYPDRRILIDWCFSVGYDLPNSLSSFYNIPIWPGFANLPQTQAQTKRELPRNKTEFEMYAKYGRDGLAQMHPQDFSAGELYEAIEDFLTSYGFDETCLLRSVCELARHPFNDQYQFILTDLVTFILSPSQHNGFLDTEHIYKQAYEEAELNGFLGKDCKLLYSHCKHDILQLISKFMFPSNL